MMHDPSSSDISSRCAEPRASLVLLSIVIVVFAAAFFVNEVDWEVSTYESYVVAADEAEDQVAVGKSSRKISYLAIGVVGLLMLVAPSRHQVSFMNLPMALLGMYVLVCMASFIWTDATWLTTKRLGIGVFGLLAIVGAAKQLSARDAIDVTLGIGIILLALSLYAELNLGTFTPLASEYRFAGVVHPNTQGAGCGLMVIAAFFGMKSSRRGKLIYFGILMLAGVFLVLTKSRTSFAACLCGVSAAWYLVASRNKQVLVGLGLPAAIGAGLVALLLVGIELSSSASTAAQFGRGAEADVGSLNGRVPLWASMIEFIAERPFLGYGYQGFWTPDRIYEVSIEQEWTVPSAHSAFLDVLLSTGLLGGMIFGLGIVVTFRRIITRCLETAEPADCFVFAALVYALIGAIFESGLSQPNGFEPFITGAAVLHVMSRRTQTARTAEAVFRHKDPFPAWKPVSAEGAP